MKAVVLALAMLLAGGSAWPQENSQDVELLSGRIMDNILDSLIEDYRRLIKERGLDPYYNPGVQGSYVVSVIDGISFSGSASDITLYGIGNVATDYLSWNPLSSVLGFDASYPRVYGSVAGAEGQINILSSTFEGEGSGSLEIINVRVAGTAAFTLGASGVEIASVNAVLSIDEIKSGLYLNILGRDISETTNRILTGISAFLKENETEFTTLIEYFIIRYLNPVL